MIKKDIELLEEQMKVEFERIRKGYENSGNKGEGVERIVRAFLKRYLPRRLDVGHGEIIDRLENRSKQTDVVIINEDHPYISDGPTIFFVEGVAAAGEVKSMLSDRQALREIIEESRAFKKLDSRPGEGTLRVSTPSDRERFSKAAPWFLFVFDSKLTLRAIVEEVDSYKKANQIEENDMVDGIFILNRGWLFNLGDGNGVLQLQRQDGTLGTGWVSQETDRILLTFLGWLTSGMPRAVRFDPILPHYIFPTFGGNKDA